MCLPYLIVWYLFHHHHHLLSNYFKVQKVFRSAHLSRLASTPAQYSYASHLPPWSGIKDLIYSLAPQAALMCNHRVPVHRQLMMDSYQTAYLSLCPLRRVSHSDGAQKKLLLAPLQNLNHSFVPHGCCLVCLLHICISSRTCVIHLIAHKAHAVSPQERHLHIISCSGRTWADVRWARIPPTLWLEEYHLPSL